LASIAKTSIILSGLGLGGSLISFVAQLSLAHTFGAGIEIDAYFVGNSLPTLVGGLLTGMMAYQVVPLLKHCDGTACSMREYQDALLQLCVLTGAITMVLGSGISWEVLRHYPNADAYCAHHAQWIAVISWAGVCVSLLTAAMTAICHVRGWFFRAACIGYVPSILTVVVCYWIAARGGSAVLVALAVLVGQSVGMTILAFRLGSEIRLQTKMAPALREVCRGMMAFPFVLLSMLTFTCFGAIDAYWAGHLDPGAVSTLAYVQRLIVALAGIGVNGVGVVMLPRFAESAAKAEKQKLLTDAAQTMRAIFLLMSPVALVVGILAKPTIGLLFEGGRFSSAETVRLAGLLPVFLAGMLPMSCCTILFRAHYALRDIWGAAVIGSAGAIIYFCLAGILLHGGGALSGFGMAYLACWLGVFWLSILRLWGRRNARVFLVETLQWSLRPIIALVGLALLGGGLRNFAPAESGSLLIRLSTIAISYTGLAVAFIMIGWFLGLPEFKSLVNLARARMAAGFASKDNGV
jgi:putative peptidoglycan lipid II flippase